MTSDERPSDGGAPADTPDLRNEQRLMVCVSPSPLSAQLVRTAARWARRLNAPWFAVHVDADRSNVEDRNRVAEHLLLAERLGARTVTLASTDVAAELLAFAHTNGVRLLVVGKSTAEGAGRRDSPLEEILGRGRGIDALVVEGDAPIDRPRSPRRGPLTARGYYWATAAVAACTVASAFLVPYIDLSNTDALYLLAVVAVAARYGRGPAVYTSALGVLAFDYFIVPPAFGFVPEDAAYVVTFIVMLAAALTVSAFAAALREQVDVARERFVRTATLYDLAADLARAADVPAVARVASEHLRQVFLCNATVVAPDAQGRLHSQESESTLTLSPRELDAARAAMTTRSTVGRGCATHAGLRTLHIPLVASDAAVGVLSLAPEASDRFDLTAMRLHLDAFANQTALALQRAQLAETAQQTKLDIDQELMRNTLLRSVSHDLRTPVAAIQGAASAILQSEALDAHTRRELLQSICDSSERLGHRIHNLLELTRLESGAVRVRLEWTPLDEVVGAALTALEGVLQPRGIRVDVPSDLPPLPLDGLLTQQVVMNLVAIASPMLTPTRTGARSG